MKLPLASMLPCISLALALLLPSNAIAVDVTGTIEPETPLGQYLSLKMTIGDATTRFEMTGPDYCYFAFGFDATTMQGYSLIVRGTDANRTAAEQNLEGVGNPGSPQATQNIEVLSTTHDAANNLTTLILERPNQTGDPEDPVFSTSMTSLNMIWGYNSSASPESPNPNLAYHGFEGRGFAIITLVPVPEPAALALAGVGVAAVVALRRRLRPRVRCGRGL